MVEKTANLEKIRSEHSENKPIINIKSRDMVRNSVRYNQPIYSEQRYEAEISRYRTSRNIEPMVKSILSKTQVVVATVPKKEIKATLPQRLQDKILTKDDFNKKYES